jgi:hypothetical protein
MHDLLTVNDVLSELGRRHSIANLRLGGEGTVGLCLKDGAEVDFEYDGRSNRLHLYTDVLPLPKEGRERLQLCEAMLELNCLEKGLSRGSLAIHRQRETVICQIGLPVTGLSCAILEDALGALLRCRRSLAAAPVRVMSADAGANAAGNRQSTVSLLAMRAQSRLPR